MPIFINLELIEIKKLILSYVLLRVKMFRSVL